MTSDKDLIRRDFWQNFEPRLHIEATDRYQDLSAINLSPAQITLMQDLILKEGYFQANGANWQLDLSMMAETVRRLDLEGLSPVFAFLYDEFWIPFYKLHHIYNQLLGGSYAMLPDFWVWNVEPTRGDAGWKPHRDKNRHSLLPDGRPKSLSTWIPLTPATTLNGCIYIVPAHLDRTYNTAEENNWSFDLPSIRALPGMPGDFFIWNQALLHWGSKASPRGGESRVSMAFETQRTDVAPMNVPLLPPLQILSFDTRLQLVCKQILQYRHMYQIDARFESLAIQVLGKDAVTACA